MKNCRSITILTVVLIIIFQSCKKDPPATPPPPPPPPSVPGCSSNSTPVTNSFVSAGSVITLSWIAAANATSYDVYLGTTSVPASAIATSITSTSVTYNVPTTANTVYYWYVQPKNSTGSAMGCAGTVTSFTAVMIQAPAAFGFYVVGYFPSYRNITEVPDVKFRMCNVVNYAFFGVNSSGTLTVNNAALVPQVVAKAKTNNAKVFVSINDGAPGNFKNMAATPAGRNNFIKDVMANVRQYNFDGVDVDWEFPRTDDGTDVTFTALIKELSDSLHRDAKYYLSIAVTAGKFAGAVRDAIKTEVFGYVDIFSIMSYDDFSTSVPYRHHSDLNLSVTSLNYWLTTRGMPKEKAVLGFPAYGRPSGITQSGNTLSYRTILSEGGNSQSDSAVITSNPAFPGGYKIYYNGQPTVKLKTMLAKQRANGVMMWEKWHDAPDANSLLKAACDTIARPY